jgi:hypothetical protein
MVEATASQLHAIARPSIAHRRRKALALGLLPLSALR